MATKNINLRTINPETLEMFSKFNVAFMSLRKLREKYKADSALIEDERTKILESRKNDLDAGIPLDTVLVKWSTVEVEKKQAVLDAQYEQDCAPHKEAKKAAMGLLDVNLYYGYLLAQQKGSLASKGSVTLKKGKKTEQVDLDKSYVDMIKAFLVSIDAGHSDDVKAVSKLANILAVRTSGMIKANKGGDYVKTKSATQYNELLLCNMLQYMVVDKGILVQQDDFSLVMA